MSCLGERLTALVDGELGDDERERALAHLAGCDRCRREADLMRRLKGRLRGLSDLPPSDGTGDLPTGDFLSRLRSLPGSLPESGGPPGGGATAEPAAPAAAAARHPSRSSRSSNRPARPSAGRPRDSRPRDGRPAARAAAVHAHPRRYLVVGAATLFLGLGAASYVAGGRQDAPAVTPAFDRFAVEHALTSGDAPVTDPLTDPANELQVSPGP
ncbi:anti-sigma factor family protein [Actinomadura madurae]|uniref:anti-sigma factor family protein n=1 Tax=Actinomadura madurae TaxID=1993 RepID=UPI002027310A|nr:zf-HC2 domain-containing protein [Actinomadura madurae]MCP9983149.1 zf-HC2 domain-containing protein [Actinomadura madurae]URM99414.1 zf-HC2 domain-containing protein [Actinomadura madurae]URN10089.1 zf-HC2 domain-containing protein [Actinomadura madurae]